MVGVLDGFSWIRCVGKGSFLNSPALKRFGEARLAAGESLLVVDLGDCSGMDSTFMGTLAGLAGRFSRKPGGALHIADADNRNRASLEDLGLDCLMEINPPAAPWRGRMDEIRAVLAVDEGKEVVSSGLARAEHVLEAHRTLSAANEDNARKFAGVVDLLSQETQRHEAAP